jgi:hypothetical protein
VDRESDPPPLEIELISASSRSTTSADEQCSAAGTGSNHRRRTRWLFACAAAIVVALVVTSLTADDSDTDDDVSPTTTVRVEPTTTALPTTVVPTTTWTATPNLLGGARTGLKLWSFDADSRLQVLDFDTGSLLSLRERGGEDVLPLDDGVGRGLGISDGLDPDRVGRVDDPSWNRFVRSAEPGARRGVDLGAR